MTAVRRACRRGRGEGGFTFIEILVVIIIISILALIAVATFLGQRTKAERSRAISAVKNAETFATAIAVEEEPFSATIADYERAAGTAPYSWQPGSIISTDPEMISVAGPNPGGEGPWVAFAAVGGDTCFFSRLGPGDHTRVRHRAQLAESFDCKAESFAPGMVPGATDLASW